MNIDSSWHGRCEWGFSILLRLILLLAVGLPVNGVVHAAGPWYVAPIGSDSNTCTAPDSPCLTINGAIAKASAGDTINVAVGIYTGIGTEVVLVDKNLSLLGGWDAAFTAQTGRSTVDGEHTRRGVTIDEYKTALIDRFVIKYGAAESSGGGIESKGVLTLNNSIIRENTARWMGAGIFSLGSLTVNNTAIRGNMLSDDYSGAGIFNYSGTVVLNNTALTANRGGAIHNQGSFILNNTTVSGNVGREAIYNVVFNTILKNSTVTRNAGGIYNHGGTVTLRNSILAGNASAFMQDCSGTIHSSGYNLLGNNSGCDFKAVNGDKVGTSTSLINPRLLPLGDNGGPTFTHALAGDSPALNAGSPAAPGSEIGACLLTDQRGVARPVDDRCDMGAFEGSFTTVASIARADANPASASTVRFTVRFTGPVTGVRETPPFSDFTLTTGGVNGASVTAVSGTGSVYTVTVNTGQGNGTIRLNLVDHDTILDGSGGPLGGPGIGNADFTGTAYTMRKIPTILYPAAIGTWDRNPNYKWSTIPAATQYLYELWKGTTLVYARKILASTCGADACTTTPSMLLLPAGYRWRVRAAASGIWQPFSAYKTFTVLGPRAGYWKSGRIDFFVTPDRAAVSNFSIYINVTGCGSYKITRNARVPISERGFSFSDNSLDAEGLFAPTALNAAGVAGLTSYYIPGCGYVSVQHFYWTAVWQSASLPEPGAAVELLPLLGPEGTFPGPFIIEPVQP